MSFFSDIFNRIFRKRLPSGDIERVVADKPNLRTI